MLTARGFGKPPLPLAIILSFENLGGQCHLLDFINLIVHI